MSGEGLAATSGGQSHLACKRLARGAANKKAPVGEEVDGRFS